MKSRSFAWIPLVAWCLAPGLAVAQTSPVEEARAHFEAGVDHYERERFGLALTEFQRAHELMDGQASQPLILFNIARTQESLGQLRLARDTYQRFLDESQPDAPQRGEALTRIRDLDSRPPEPGPTGPGPDETVVAQTSVSAGDPVPAIIGFAVGGAGLATFAIFGGLALGEDSRIADLPCATTQTCSDAELSDLGTLALVADIGIGIAAAGAIAGVILLFTVGQDSGGGQASIVPLIDPTTGTAGLAAGGTF